LTRPHGRDSRPPETSPCTAAAAQLSFLNNNNNNNNNNYQQSKKEITLEVEDARINY
jgi:hypothetical protein